MGKRRTVERESFDEEIGKGLVVEYADQPGALFVVNLLRLVSLGWVGLHAPSVVRRRAHGDRSSPMAGTGLSRSMLGTGPILLVNGIEI
jgi:hypothetical protein